MLRAVRAFDAPHGARGAPASERPARIPRARTTAYVLLLALVIASVFRLVPYPVALGAVVVGLLLLDRRALRSVDVGLLLTFACFFVFAGNMARIPAVEDTLSQVMAHHAPLASAGASQVISNVPAAVLLSHFTDSYPALLVGVNIGGAGTSWRRLPASSRSISTGPCAPRSDAAPASHGKLRAGSLRASPRSTASFSWCCTQFAARRDSTPSL